MKLIEALDINRRPVPPDAPPLEVALACGFTPLHLDTFLGAELRCAAPRSRVSVAVGVFDDLLGNLERAASSTADAIAIVVEWADIDPRLGLRRLGGWSVEDLPDVFEQSELYLHELVERLTVAAERKPVVCCLPTLPLPPLFPHRPGRSGSWELRLRERLASTAAALAQNDRIRLCSAQFLDERSPLSTRREVRAELATGAPYTLSHASAVAEALAGLVVSRSPKKGLITDLDGTLWAGIVGEIGVDAISWSLDTGSQRHALYQQLLASLASAGALVGVASKNDERIVAEAFERPDLLLPKDTVFPFEVHWGAKSASVAQILEAWNIAPDAVAFVDDNPIELAEVQDAFPDIECIRFPASDAELWPFLECLRSLFGKERTTAEDALRVASLRGAREFRGSAATSARSSDEFLARVEGALTFRCDEADTGRAYELLNKTNQFNVNGLRLTEGAFDSAISDPGTFLVTVAYQDRFGPLGTIAMLLVRPDDQVLVVDSWVMSCRAFSRRIEHHALDYLFERFRSDEIAMAYRPTDRNGPVQEFLTSLLGAAPEHGTVRITREAFQKHRPLLVHRVMEDSIR